MYKFVPITGSCGNPYDLGVCEKNANEMKAQGYELIQVYQTTTAGCFGTQSTLVMVFERR